MSECHADVGIGVYFFSHPTLIIATVCEVSYPLLFSSSFRFGEYEVENYNVLHAVCVQGSQFSFFWCFRKFTVHETCFFIFICSSYDRFMTPSALLAGSTSLWLAIYQYHWWTHSCCRSALNSGYSLLFDWVYMWLQWWQNIIEISEETKKAGWTTRILLPLQI